MIDYAFLDKVLKETHDSGQKLAFRVMCCSPYKGRPYHPAWLKEVGGRELMALSIAVVEGTPPAPVVRLGIKGRADDGWYPLSKIEVVK